MNKKMPSVTVSAPELVRWYFLLVLGIICISTSAILVTVAGAAPTTAAFYRNFFAAMIWLALYRYSTPLKQCAVSTNSEVRLTLVWLKRLMDRGGICLIFLILGISFAVDLWAWHRCIVLVGAGPATLMGNVQVVFIAFLSRLVFGEVLKRYYWFGSGLALVGIGLLTLTGGVGERVVLGVLYGLVTALTYALFLIFLKILGRYEISPEQTLFWVSTSTMVFLAIPFLLYEPVLLPRFQSLSWLLLHAFVSSVVGWWLIVRALQVLPVAQAATFLLLQPLLTSLWGHIFLEQHLQMIQVVGIVVALIGIRLANWQK